MWCRGSSTWPCAWRHGAPALGDILTPLSSSSPKGEGSLGEQRAPCGKVLRFAQDDSAGDAHTPSAFIAFPTACFAFAYPAHGSSFSNDTYSRAVSTFHCAPLFNPSSCSHDTGI